MAPGVQRGGRGVRDVRRVLRLLRGHPLRLPLVSASRGGGE